MEINTCVIKGNYELPGICVDLTTEKKSKDVGNGFNSFVATKFAEEVPFLSIFIEAPGAKPFPDIMSPPPPILINPVTLASGFNNPV